MKRWGRVLENRQGVKATTINGYSNFHEEALPKVMTPHTLLHMFCPNLANAGRIYYFFTTA